MQSKRLHYSLTIVISFFYFTQSFCAVEQIAIVFVVDQFAHHALETVKPYLQGGIRLMLDNGILYNNAHYPYVGTGTGPGHTCLSTGTLPKDNGIIKNSWFNNKGEKILCDEGPAHEAAVFTPAGTVYPIGKSAQQITVDSLSDQLMLGNDLNEHNAVYSLSLKPRAAVCSAGRLGKAFWFDSKASCLTTGRAYFHQLPHWLVTFNTKQSLSSITFTWQLMYPRKHPAYSFLQNFYYEFSMLPSLIDKPVNTDSYTKLPESNNYLLKASKACLQEAKKQEHKKILLWVCLSSLDPIGHVYGPHSLEYIDTIYHVDKYLEKFIKWVNTTFSDTKTLFVLTADHGSTPIPELMQKQGFNLAQRINKNELQNTINEFIFKKHGIENMVLHSNTLSLFLDKKKLAILKPSLKKKILNDIKHYIRKQPGIKNAWTSHELETCSFQKNDIRNYFFNSLYQGRSGEIQYQLDPYCFVTKHQRRTCHSSPYDYTTHVPLIMYQHKSSQKKIIEKPVTMTQVAPTLARFFSIAAPSACRYEPLPEFKHIIDTHHAS